MEEQEEYSQSDACNKRQGCKRHQVFTDRKCYVLIKGQRKTYTIKTLGISAVKCLPLTQGLRSAQPWLECVKC